MTDVSVPGSTAGSFRLVGIRAIERVCFLLPLRAQFTCELLPVQLYPETSASCI